MLATKISRVGFFCAFLYAALMVTSIGVNNDKDTVRLHWSLPWRSSLTLESFPNSDLPYKQDLWSLKEKRQYSLELSTAENYKSDGNDFYGRYTGARSHLDYSYHDNFIKSRQLLQDDIIDKMLNGTWIRDGNGEICERATEPWIVFTAGAMGAGKSYTLRHLAVKGRFPLHSFVTVDPDEIRRHLPEFDLYVQRNPDAAGEKTRKEAGYISEILTMTALKNGRNVLVDGSLRDSDWYKRYFSELRTKQSNLRIGILHVTAPRYAIFQRAKDRSKTTGRVVPHDTLELALEQVPKSVQVLKPLSDFFAEIHNAPAAQDLELRAKGQTWESFRRAWAQTCAKQ